MAPAPQLRREGMDAVVKTVSELVQKLTGVQLGERQRSMVEARVSRRMLDLKLATADDYARYLSEHFRTESTTLVAILTTHHTFFFREFEHFEYLRDQALPRIAETLKRQGKRHLRVWSMACSRGQEVYSLAMFLSVHWPRLVPGGTFEVYGTDVDQESVKVAVNGVYRFDELKSVPSQYMGQHWARGTGDIAQFVKAKASLRQVVRFGANNLIELAPGQGHGEFDVVFCRNVFIYFTPEQIGKVVQGISSYMPAHGYLILGTTESLSGLQTSFVSVGPSIYATRAAQAEPAKPAAKPSADAPNVVAMPRRPIKVLCVDDSPTIHAVLGKVLTPDRGFEIVGKAMNGEEAAKLAASTKFDVMTLDIHMPVKNGVDYLRDHYGPNHPPVVIVSSISREETTLGVKTLELGAADYVEKPSLANLSERADELRTKLRCVTAIASADKTTLSAAALAMAKTMERQSVVPKVDTTLRIILCALSDRAKVSQLVLSLASPQPPTLLFVDGPGGALTAFAEALAKNSKLPVKVVTPSEYAAVPSAGRASTIWVLSQSDASALAASAANGRMTVVLAYDGALTGSLKAFPKTATTKVILEETVVSGHDDAAVRRSLCDQVLPYTSFLFDSDYILNKG